MEPITSKPISRLETAFPTDNSRKHSESHSDHHPTTISKLHRTQSQHGNIAPKKIQDTARLRPSETHPGSSENESSSQDPDSQRSESEMNSSHNYAKTSRMDDDSEISHGSIHSSSSDTPQESSIYIPSHQHQEISRRNISSAASTSSSAAQASAKVATSGIAASELVSHFGCSPSVPKDFGTMVTTVTMRRSSTTSTATCHSATCCVSLKAISCKCQSKEVLSPGALAWSSSPATATPASGRGQTLLERAGVCSTKGKKRNSTAGSLPVHISFAPHHLEEIPYVDKRSRRL